MILVTQLALFQKTFSQNVSINSTGAQPDASAMLDVSSTTGGFLMPRLTTVQRDAITSPATGLTLFNTTLVAYQVNTGTPGTPIWSTLTTSATANAWSLGGNSLVSAQTIGTITNFDFPFITNNIERMRLSAGGNLGIGAAVTDGVNAEKLLVDAGSNSYNVISGRGNTNGFLQLNIKNANSGTSASSDVVATNDLGTEANGLWFVDMGMNSSTYNLAAFNITGVGDAYLYTTGNDFAIGNATAAKSLKFFTGGTVAGNERMRIDGSGYVGIGITAPTAVLHLKAGTATAGTAPLKFTSGTLMSAPQVGAVEFLTDKFYGTITTGAARKEFTMNDIALTSGRVPFTTTIGRLTDLSTFTYASNRLSPRYLTLAAGTATANTAPLVMTAGVNLTTPVAGAVEFDGTHYYGTVGVTRYQLDQQVGTTYTGSNGITLVANDFRNNLITGLAGGQTIIGGTAAGNSLTLSSTSNGTKGNIVFGSSAYDEVNNRLGIGNSTPSEKLDVTGNVRFSGALMPDNLAGAAGSFLTSNGAGAAPTWSTATSGTNTGDVTIGTANGLSLAGQALSLGLASTSTNGALSSTDWNTFNNKATTTGSWSTTGNTGTSSATNFLGTTDAQDLVFRANNIEKLRLINSTSQLQIGNADSGVIKSTKEFVMRQDGDQFGSSVLRLRNRNGENGAIFETIDASVKLVDFIFRTGTVATPISSNIRFETRSGSPIKVTGNTTEWQIGQPDDVNGGPTLIIGASGTGNNSALAIGNFGIGNLNPAEKLDVTGNVKFIGALMPNSLAGASGTYLTSAGSGVSPTWTAITASSLGAITSLNGLTTTSQTFAVPGTTGVAPAWSSAGSVHTLNIPLASAASVTAGLLSNTDYATFNNKQPQLNGTGFVKASGTTITYDNSTYLTANQSISFAPTGDVTGTTSGTTTLAPVLAIGANKVTLAQMAQVANGTFLGRTTTGTGNVEALTTAQAKTLLGSDGTNTGDVTLAGQNYLSLTGQVITANPVDLSTTHATGILATARFPALTGDVTNTAGTVATTIATGVVSNTKLATMAANTFKANATGGVASPTDITGTQATAMLNTFNTLKGLVPGVTSSTTQFLRADGTFAVPPGTNAGTVTSVSVITANGISGAVATSTTTPAITLTLGAITPTSVAASGTITGSNLSGTNTGDVTIGTANGLSLAAQALSLGLAGASTTGALSTTDWNTFNNKASTTNSWSTTGNTGTTSTTNFIGTTDNKSFKIKSNANQGFVLDSLGNVGIGVNPTFSALPAREKFLVDAGVTTSINAMAARGTINSYLQFNIQNLSNGANATTDIVATANNGTESSNYVDLGINGSAYTGGAIETGVANDGYLISAGNDFYMVNSSSNKSMLFLTGGTGVANERMRILANGRVGMGVQDPNAPFVVKDTMEIRRIGSLSQLLFTNTAVTGDFRIGGDGGDLYWQGGGGRALQMGSYWTTILGGDRQGAGGAYPAFINGVSGTGVSVESQRDGSVPLAIKAFSATQSANLTEWRNSSGTVLSAVSNIGNFAIGGSAPSEKLDVTGNVRFSGALMPNNLPGASGTFLTSAGAGASPTWTAITASGLGAITSLNGLTTTSQTFAVPGTSGVAPSWSSAGSVHTLNIPLASAASVTAGLLSNADYSTFNNKQPQLNGTGFVKASGTTITYDNSTYLTANQSISFAPTGDVTGTTSGTTTLAPVLAIGANKVTLAQMAQVANGTFLGRTTAGTGNVEALTTAQAKTLLGSGGTNSGDVTLAGQNYLSLAGQVITANAVNLAGTNVTGILAATSFPALTGDVTNTAGTVATTIATGVVSNTKLATMAANTFKANATGGVASPTDITGTQATAMLNTFNTLKGLVPGVASSTTQFLRADGTFAVPPGATAGTVTSVSVTTANGVSGVVATNTTTPAITLTLGAITPTSVAASGTVSGSNLSGTNTGDVTIGTANGLSLAAQALSLGLAGASTTGALSTADWNTFNNKASTTNSWSTTGNTGTTSTTNFIGTTDNKSFKIKTNANQGFILDSLGNVGIGVNPTFNALPAREKFLVDAGVTTSINAIAARGSINNYLQLNIQNLSTGTNATSDIVATADNGDENDNYVDLGINGSGYTGGAIETGVANDAYLISKGHDFYMVNGSPNNAMLFLTGGTGVANERMRILANGRVGMGVQNPTAPFVVKDTMEIRRVGSLSQLLFTNTAGTGDFRIGGDGGDLFWQGGGSRGLQMGSFWTTILTGDRQTSAYPAFVNSPGGTGVLVLGQRDGSVPLAIQAFSGTQSANLTEWRNSSGTVLNAVSNIGNFGIGNSAPSEKFDVTGNVRFSGALMPNNLAGTAGTFLTSNGAGVAPTWTSSPNTTSWGLTGNSLTTSTTNFIGTTDVKSFKIKTNSVQGFLLDSLGNVGIGINPTFSALPAREKFLVDAGTTTSINAISGKGAIDSYFQLNIQNRSATANASSDIVATSDNGDEANGFVNLGINSSAYNVAAYNLGGFNDSYLYSVATAAAVGGNFSIGTGSAGKILKFHTGGTATGNERMRIDGTGNVGINNQAPAQKLDVTGNFKLTGAFMPNALPGAVGEFLISNGANTSPLWLNATPFVGTVAWVKAGNAGTTSVSDYLGTSDARSFKIKTAGAQGFLLDSLGNVGIGVNPTFSALPAREKFLVDAGVTTSINAISAKGTINNYLQLNIQNQSTGSGASSDIVATSNNGTETTNFIDMGINGSGNTSNIFGNANDAYLYNQGENFFIANSTALKSLIFLTGGTDSATNERMRIAGNGNIGIGMAIPPNKLSIAAANPLYLLGVQDGTASDSLLTILNGIVKKVAPSTLPVANAWALTGNATTNPTSNFLGTTDNQAVVFKVNNQQIGRLEQTSFAWGAGSSTNTATNSMALGNGTTLGSGIANAIAIGNFATATIGNTFAIGHNAISNPTNGDNSFAIGNSATVNSTGSFVIGPSATTAVNISNAFALGKSAVVNGTNSMAIGNTATIGTGATAAIAIGNGALSNAAGSISIGTATVGTSSTNSVAIGNGASIGSSLTNSTAIGPNASTTFSNTMILGDRSNSLLSVGIGSENFSTSTREKLLVDAGTVASDGYISVIGGKGSTNNYMQINAQNRSNGAIASTDIVATNDAGTEANLQWFIDMGINSSGNTSTGLLGGSNTAYLYSTGNDFVIGNSTTSKPLRFYTTNASAVANEAMRIEGTGNVNIGPTATPNSVLQVNGSVSMAITTQTVAAYTVTASNYTILCNNSANMTVNLPTAVGVSGRVYVIKRLAASFTVTVDPAGSETIDAATTSVLNTQYAKITIQSDGANWFIIAN